MVRLGWGAGDFNHILRVRGRDTRCHSVVEVMTPNPGDLEAPDDGEVLTNCPHCGAILFIDEPCLDCAKDIKAQDEISDLKDSGKL
jgi:hypothetical protein